VFKKVASKYDVMNDFMSVGIHRLWKDSFVKKLGPSAGTRLLDVAGGTGDISFRFLRAAAKAGAPTGSADSSTHAYICDINPYMLEQGRIRAETEPGIDKDACTWIEGELRIRVQQMPLSPSPTCTIHQSNALSCHAMLLTSPDTSCLCACKLVIL
jgi:ubiquinone/menaquinone biosynthesis C-methylase UbiE